MALLHCRNCANLLPLKELTLDGYCIICVNALRSYPTALNQGIPCKACRQTVAIKEISTGGLCKACLVQQEMLYKEYGKIKPSETPMKETESLCQEAERIIGGDRKQDYGDYSIEAKKLAQLWSAITGKEILPRHVSLMMAGLKLLRQSNKPKRDNLVDAIGYILLSEHLKD